MKYTEVYFHATSPAKGVVEEQTELSDKQKERLANQVNMTKYC
jgi:hypothetical protein